MNLTDLSQMQSVTQRTTDSAFRNDYAYYTNSMQYFDSGLGKLMPALIVLKVFSKHAVGILFSFANSL